MREACGHWCISGLAEITGFAEVVMGVGSQGKFVIVSALQHGEERQSSAQLLKLGGVALPGRADCDIPGVHCSGKWQELPDLQKF